MELLIEPSDSHTVEGHLAGGEGDLWGMCSTGGKSRSDFGPCDATLSFLSVGLGLVLGLAVGRGGSSPLSQGFRVTLLALTKR